MIIMARFSKRKLPNGVLPAARKFDFPDSTVRVNIKNYKEAKFENEEHRKRPRKNRGAKTLLPSKLDGKVLQMKKKYEASRLCPQIQENGGNLNTFYGVKQFFRRIDFTKRQAATAKQPMFPSFWKEMGFCFHQAIKELVDAYDIPDDKHQTKTSVNYFTEQIVMNNSAISSGYC